MSSEESKRRITRKEGRLAQKATSEDAGASKDKQKTQERDSIDLEIEATNAATPKDGTGMLTTQIQQESALDLLRLQNEAARLEIEKLKLEMRKMELHASMNGNENTPSASAYSIDAHSLPAKPLAGTSFAGTSVNFSKLMSAGEKMSNTKPDQTCSDDDHYGTGSGFSSDESGSDSETTWTKVEKSGKSTYRSKANAVSTTGEQSDWKRAKFLFLAPIHTLKCDTWLKRLNKYLNRTDGTGWSEADYRSQRARLLCLENRKIQRKYDEQDCEIRSQVRENSVGTRRFVVCAPGRSLREHPENRPKLYPYTHHNRSVWEWSTASL